MDYEDVLYVRHYDSVNKTFDYIRILKVLEHLVQRIINDSLALLLCNLWIVDCHWPGQCKYPDAVFNSRVTSLSALICKRGGSDV